PHYLDWLAGRLGQARSLHRAFSRVLAAVSRAGVRHDHAHLPVRNAERRGQLIAYCERALRARPYRQPVSLPFRDGGPWLERSMLNVGYGVSLRKSFGCGGHRRGNGAGLMVAASAEPARLRVRVFAQVVKETSLRDLLRRAPFSFQLRERMLRAFQIGRGDAHKITVMYDF